MKGQIAPIGSPIAVSRRVASICVRDLIELISLRLPRVRNLVNVDMCARDNSAVATPQISAATLTETLRAAPTGDLRTQSFVNVIQLSQIFAVELDLALDGTRVSFVGEYDFAGPRFRATI